MDTAIDHRRSDVDQLTPVDRTLVAPILPARLDTSAIVIDLDRVDANITPDLAGRVRLAVGVDSVDGADQLGRALDGTSDRTCSPPRARTRSQPVSSAPRPDPDA